MKYPYAFLLILLCAAVHADDPSSTELLLPAGTLYSMARRSYSTIKLPVGWTVVAGAYSPDDQSIALVLAGTGLASKPVHSKATLEGPINKVMQLWTASTRLGILDRRTGKFTRSWRLLAPADATEWSVAWTSASWVRATFSPPGASARTFSFDVTKNLALQPMAAAAPARSPNDLTACPSTLAETDFKGKSDRFAVERAHCSTPPETSDFYRIVRDNAQTQKEMILWEYRVSADTTTCSAPYACYSGASAEFLSTDAQLFLAWDGDVYTLDETDDGMKAELATQLLPQYGRPWGIASGETNLNALDIVNKVTFQPVMPALSIAHTGGPTLYAQNFCKRRGFNATVNIGPYTKSLMVPAGYQVGPVSIGDFKDRAYTPLLITATWTSFHHLAEPVKCAEPYTILPTTKGLIVSITETDQGKLQCHVDFQED